MRSKIYKTAILLSVSIIILMLRSDDSRGCGWTPEPDSYYNIFAHKLFNIPLLKPFFLSENDFFNYDQHGPLSSETANLKTWLAHYNNVPTIDDIDDIIYHTGQNDIAGIENYLRTGNADSLGVKLRDNTLISYWKGHRYQDDLDYILFAKQCEPYVYVSDEWQNLQYDSTKMSELVLTGEKRFSSIRSEFLKERYGYQVVRLLHYSHRYKEAIDFYDKNFEGGNQDLIGYWTLEHKAGCIYHFKNFALSNFIFAKIFDQCPSRRISCSKSYKLGSDSLLNATLALCKNADEKAAVITLQSYKSGDMGIDAMKEIYSLNPKSDYLELLLERGITRMEREVLPPRYDILQQYGRFYNYTVSGPYTQFADEVSKIAGSNKTEHPYLWYFAAGYIYTLNHEDGKAGKFYVKAKQLCPKNDLSYINRIKIAEIISKVDGLKRIDAAAESSLFDDLKWLRDDGAIKKLKSQEAYYYVMSLLGLKYYAQNDTAKANLCMGIKLSADARYDFNEPALGYNIAADYYKEPLRLIYNFITTRNLSDYDKFLIQNYCLTESGLKEIMGTKLLLEHKFKEAAGMLSPVSYVSYYENYLKSLPADPFIIHINDCHDCDYAGKKERSYTKASFAERMAELEKLAQTDTANRDKYYSLLANGYYNTTMYGNNWVAINYPQPGSWGMLNRPFDLPGIFYDCSTAQEYYVKAMDAARDKEFAAKCCFMASKCEQNTFYNKVKQDSISVYDSTKYFALKSQYRNFFRVMKDKYAGTQFYKEAIEECKYFNEFVKRN